MDMEFNPEELNDILEEETDKAKELLQDVDKMEEFLQKLENKLKAFPVGGDYLAYIPTMISLVRMYTKKEYTEAPVSSIIAIVVALIYWANPFDIIPDSIFGIGLADDVAVIAGAVSIVGTDIEDYQKWREKNGMVIDDLPKYENLGEKHKRFVDLFNMFKKKKEESQNKEDVQS